jgi:DNA-directed RNA polymerase omega subunit
MFKLPENLKSKYEFVTLAARRAEQLQTGALPRVTLPTNKLTVIAQQEVASGLVKILDPASEAPLEQAEEE